MPIYNNALAQQPANRLAYQDRIGATPRNEYLGALADFLAQSYAPQRTQQMQGVAQFLGVPAVSQTLDRLSYGEPLTTGAGMTTRVRPEALEAAMTLAPLYRPAGMAAKEAVAMTKGLPVGMSIKSVAPQEEALRLAQQRAALPPSQGGLGLPANNTAEQRAKAMGFDYDTTRFHGSDQDIYAFDPARFGKNDQGWYGRGVTTDTDPEVASGYANYNEAQNGQAVYPLVSRGKYMDWPDGQPPFATAKDSIQGTKDIQGLGYQGTRMTNDRDLYGNQPQLETEQVTFNPDDIRSRFAAFDPFRRTAAIAATMGVAAPDLLAAEQAQQDAYTQNEMRKFMRQGRR
jgi:hypothetical protein